MHIEFCFSYLWIYIPLHIKCCSSRAFNKFFIYFFKNRLILFTYIIIFMYSCIINKR